MISALDVFITKQITTIKEIFQQENRAIQFVCPLYFEDLTCSKLFGKLARMLGRRFELLQSREGPEFDSYHRL